MDPDSDSAQPGSDPPTSGGGGTLLIDADGLIHGCDPDTAARFGYSRTALIGLPVLRLIPGLRLDAPSAAQRAWGLRRDLGSLTLELRWLAPIELGGRRLRRLLVMAPPPEVGLPQATIEVLAQLPDSALVTDDRDRIVYANPAWERLSGYALAEVRGHNALELLRGEPGHGPDSATLRAALRRGETVRAVFLHRRCDGSLYHHDQALSALRAGGEAIGHYLALGRDVSELMREQQHLRYLAHHDPLTGLPNRAMFHDLANRALARARRGNCRVALLYIDLDGFKAVNDTLGHAAGDQVLCAVAGRLRAGIRASDVAARLGGDEFVVLLEDVAQPRDAERVARAALDALNAPLMLDSGPRQIGASIGIAFSDDAGDAAQLLERADAAMYEAKRGARNGLRIAAAARPPEQPGNGFLLHYQPRARLTDGQITGVEALLRLQHPVDGLLRPADFLPALAADGGMRALSGWVLNEACQQARRWHAQGHRLDISVNLCAEDVHNPALPALIQRTLTDSGLPPRCLALEIPYAALRGRAHETSLQTALVALAALGVRIEVDDYCDGVDALRELQGLPLTAIKVDPGMVRLLTRCGDHGLADRRDGLSAGEGWTLIAEGVETAAELRGLSGALWDGYQGHVLTQPLTAASLARFLEDAPAPTGAPH